MKNFSWTLILIEPLLFPLQSPCLKKEKSIFLLFLSSVCLQRRNNPLALGAHRLMKLTRGEDHPWEAAKSHPRGSVFSPIWHFVLHLLRHFLLHGFSESHLSWSSSYLSASWWPWQISLSECAFPASFLSCVALAPAPFPSPRPGPHCEKREGTQPDQNHRPANLRSNCGRAPSHPGGAGWGGGRRGGPGPESPHIAAV